MPRCQVSPRCEQHGRLPEEAPTCLPIPFLRELILGLAAHSLVGPVGVEVAFEGVDGLEELGDGVEVEPVDRFGLEGPPGALDQPVRPGVVCLREAVPDARPLAGGGDRRGGAWRSWVLVPPCGPDSPAG